MSLRVDALLEYLQITVEFRSRTEEQFAFEIIDEEIGINRVRRQAFTHDTFRCDDQFRSFQFRRARHEKQNRQGNAEKNGRIEIDRHRRDRRDQNQCRIIARCFQRIKKPLEIDQPRACGNEQQTC